MAGIEKRIEALEGLIGAPEDEGTARETAKVLMRAILDEFARLKASRAGGSRGGVPIVPEDIPGKILGPGYTTGEMVRLACRRVAEREMAGDLDEGEIGEVAEGWTDGMRSLYERMGKGHLWDRVEFGGWGDAPGA